MSASYVVFSTPHSRWNMASHPLDDALAEDAVGTNHEGEDHQHVRGEVFRTAPHVRIDVTRGHVLHDADDEAAHDGAGDGVESAQDDHGKDLEPHQGEVDVDAEQVAPEDAAECGHDPGHGPGQPEVALHVDAHRHGHLLVVRHGAHGDALARLQEEPAEPGEKEQAHHAPH